MIKYNVETPKHSDNPRYYRDSIGQWWYQPLSKDGKKWPRIRAFVKTCDCCGTIFLWQARTRHNKTKSVGYYCCIQCANKSVKAQIRNVRRGPQTKTWKGGRRKNADGYIQIWAGDHPARNANNYIYEHRLVMEQILGRQLEHYEEVHHKNGIRHDNRPENLELWIKRQPGGSRATDLLEYAHWVIETYGVFNHKS